MSNFRTRPQPIHDRAAAGRLGKAASPFNRPTVAGLKEQRYHTIRRICERLREERAERAERPQGVRV